MSLKFAVLSAYVIDLQVVALRKILAESSMSILYDTNLMAWRLTILYIVLFL